MMIFRALLLAVVMILLFSVTGQLMTHSKQQKTDDICLCFVTGFFGCVGLFWVEYLILLAVNASFSALVILYSISLMGLFSYSVYTNKGFLNFDYRHKLLLFSRQTKYEKIYMIAFFVLSFVLLLLNGITTAGEQTYDDAEYLVTANDAISFNSILTRRPDDGAFSSFNIRNALNSWNYFIAYLAKIFGLRVTLVAHTVLAILLLFVALVVYYIVAKKLFEEKENQWIFLILLLILFIFGSYSHYSPTFRLLASIWQHKGVLYAIVLPYTVAVVPDLLEEKNAYIRALALCTATCSLSLMGTGLAAVIWGAEFVMVSIKNKKITGFSYVLMIAAISALQLAAFLLIRRASVV